MPIAHRPMPVEGYTEQAQSKIDLVNENKRLEELVLRQLDKIRSIDGMDPRWLATGRTDIEKGFMAINRGIFQPQRIEGEI